MDESIRHRIKADFDWEIPFESVPLPSRGLIYTPDSPFYKKDTIGIKAMTAREEDILASPALNKDGNVLSALIKSCIIDKDVDVDDLIEGDRFAIMVAIRITGYGKMYSATAKCAECKKDNKLSVDLSQLKIKFIDSNLITVGKNEFRTTLPITKKEVVFSLLTEKERRNQREAERKKEEFLNLKREDRAITADLERSVISIENIRDRNKISMFIQNMPALDSRHLRKIRSQIEPTVDTTHEFTCEHCRYQNSGKLPITSEFFWPSA